MAEATDVTHPPRRIQLPGFGLPLDHSSGKDYETAFSWRPTPVTLRELCMMHFMEQITNKPKWEEKIHDEAILSKWRGEAAAANWSAAGLDGGDFSDMMFDYCIAELKDKATLFERTGIVPTLDFDALVAKSDVAIDEMLRDELRRAVAPLEDVPESERDWHPGSDDKVLDLVHPSLWPVVWGRTRALPDREISLRDCLQACGSGEVVAALPETMPYREHIGEWGGQDTKVWSHRFQWLPCEVEFPNGKDAKIGSYINNLHPVRHANLYSVIEKIISKALPLWDLATSMQQEPTEPLATRRLSCDALERDCHGGSACEDKGCYTGNRPREEDEMSDYSADEAWFDETHPHILPEPEKEYAPGRFEDAVLQRFNGRLLGDSSDGRLQVIVKLANIHLTPEKPTYDGGSWHIEGQLNEHICATALYYYDCDNITDSYLAFRGAVESEDFQQDISYEQGDTTGTKRVFGITNDSPAVQAFGRVLTREGRLLAFPNVFQHAVQPFRLADPARPGHRKILALFLVDPNCRILSTANVPPQRKDWWLEQVAPAGRYGTLEQLPTDITNLVLGHIADFPIDLAEAKRLREELMSERTVISNNITDRLEAEQWSFCEH